jgi:predicted ATPase
MLIEHIKVSGLLSFGPAGIDLPMRPLNVFIGANGSGKSNFLEVLGLLRACPKNLPAPVKEMGGVHEWLWKGEPAGEEAVIDAVISNPGKPMPLRHVLRIREHGGRFEVADESIENARPYPDKNAPFFFYRYQRGHPVLHDFGADERRLRREQVLPEESILSQLKDPDRYPALTRLQEAYGNIRMFRNWAFGPGAALRRNQSAQGRTDFLDDGGGNLALVLSTIRTKIKKDLRISLQKLYGGIEDIGIQITGSGEVLLFVEETGGREIPATRLSDGTLRYLCLVALLLHPEPPPLLVIEEPELGLHPDVIPHIADLLKAASLRTQIVVTTHSRALVDAMGDQPDAVVVCEKRQGVSMFERLDAEHLSTWLKNYSLAELWSIGELGGNRW